MKWIDAETTPIVGVGRHRQFIVLFINRQDNPVTRVAHYLNQCPGDFGDNGEGEGTGWFKYEYDEYYALNNKVIAYAEIPEGPAALLQFRGGPW